MTVNNDPDFNLDMALMRRRTTLTTAGAAKLVTEFDASNQGNRHKYMSENGQYIYHIAIIDYL